MGVTITDLSSYNFINNIKYGEKIVFLKFGAEWCTPCSELDKILVKVPDSIIYNISIDNEEFESFLKDNKIYTIPDTIVKYKDSIARFQGLQTYEQIMEIIQKLKKVSE